MKPMDFKTKLDHLLTDTGMQASTLADKMDCTPGFISQLRSGFRTPGAKTLRKLSKIFSVSLDFWEEEHPGKGSKIPDRHPVPKISWVQAGQFHEAIDIFQPGYAEEWFDFNMKDSSGFALVVHGDSMHPEFREGDIIFVSPSIESQTGDYIVAKYDEEVTFKRYRKVKDGVELVPLNMAYQPISLSGRALRKFKVVGKVVASLRRY